jgi:hypothetical protein
MRFHPHHEPSLGFKIPPPPQVQKSVINTMLGSFIDALARADAADDHRRDTEGEKRGDKAPSAP